MTVTHIPILYSFLLYLFLSTLVSLLYSFITCLCIPKKHNVVLPIFEWYLNGITFKIFEIK